ncbi:pyroglutamyl-peptidase I [Rothia nasimurium]|uniref:pyroglutamyl-peptidase I family protein n=1 Tax=Rothia nasimurium TaxID=85336 RepID=UPI001F259DDE|nr:pyroglutamyl-peptidase I [Rothia nasimurium]
MTTLLLTYFGPFEGVPINPSQAVAFGAQEALAISAPHLTVEVHELPVEFAESSRALGELLERIKPELAISLGVAAGRDKVSLERVAINLDSARIPDNAGAQLIDQPIRGDGPDAYFSTLPTRAIFEQLISQKLPVELSYTAGTFVCNHVFYELMHATAGAIPAGFIHIPLTRAEAGEGTDATAGRPQVTASADAGGVEGRSLPTLPESQVIGIIEQAVLTALTQL